MRLRTGFTCAVEDARMCIVSQLRISRDAYGNGHKGVINYGAPWSSGLRDRFVSA